MSKILSKLEGTSWKVTTAAFLFALCMAINENSDSMPEGVVGDWMRWGAEAGQYVAILLFGWFARDDDVSSEGTTAVKTKKNLSLRR